MSGDLDWRVAGGVDLGGVAGDPLLRELDDDELDAAREARADPWGQRRREAARLERERAAWRAGRRRPTVILVADQALCGETLWAATSTCLRLEGHAGRHVVARRPADRFEVEFYAPAPDGAPELLHTMSVPFPEPSGLELAELWSVHEEFGTGKVNL